MLSWRLMDFFVVVICCCRRNPIILVKNIFLLILYDFSGLKFALLSNNYIFFYH